MTRVEGQSKCNVDRGGDVACRFIPLMCSRSRSYLEPGSPPALGTGLAWVAPSRGGVWPLTTWHAWRWSLSWHHWRPNLPDKIWKTKWLVKRYIGWQDVHSHAHTRQWGEVQQANSIHTKAHSHSILMGGRPLSFWLDRGLAASPKTKNRVLWDPSPTQGRGGHSYMFSTPYNRAF